MLSLSLVVFCAVAISISVVRSDDAPVNSIELKIVNNAGAPIEVFWKNTFVPEVELVKQSSKPIRNGTDTIINSYDGHTFLAKYYKNDIQDSVEFVKQDVDETVTIEYDEANGMVAHQVTKLDKMRNKMDSALQECRESPVMSECMTDAVMGDFLEAEKRHEVMKKYRNRMASRLRNYTCADPDMETSEPINIHHVAVDGKTYEVQDMFENEHARIWTVENFLTQEECDVLMTHGKPRLTRATVAAEDGSSVVSRSRRANQATYDSHRSPSDPLHNLYGRILQFANGKANLNLDWEGQEGFTIIQYDETDEYYPHCDGSCDHSPHVRGGRVATSVLYCKVPIRGGATSFTKADVFVNPKPLMATFFSYYNSEDGLMDDGYTEHSGCPVIEGEKWITAAWMRQGVDAKHPWDIFDPSGVEILRYDENGAPLGSLLADGEYYDEDEYENGKAGCSSEL